jgi:hypothetical protein
MNTGLRLLASKRIWLFILFFALLATVTYVRFRLLNMPLERDEGAFACMGQLLLQGVPPYQQEFDFKLPGIYAAYALIMGVFGETTRGIHAGVILVNLATTGLVFVLARRVGGEVMGTLAAGTFALLSIIPQTLGLAAHATHFVMLCALAGIVLLQNLDNRTQPARVFCAGLLLGLAIMMKQSGAAFGLFAASWIVWLEFASTTRNWRRLAIRLGVLAVGGLLPFALTCLGFLMTGGFANFWLWTFSYPRVYSSAMSFEYGLENLAFTGGPILSASLGLWAFSVLGVFLLFYDESLRRWWFFVVSFTFFSVLAVCPGWYFRGHYFIQLMPAAGLLAAVALQMAAKWFSKLTNPSPPPLPAACFVVAVLWTLFDSGGVFFQLTPVQASRAVYGMNPFPEAVEIARYLSRHSAPDAKIAVIGSEPEIYFYSHRRPATGYIYVYPLVVPQPYAPRMRSEFIQQIEKANPDYVVFVNIPDSWRDNPAADPTTITDWFNDYATKGFDVVGLVNILPSGETDYRWSKGPEDPLPKVAYNLAVLKNRTVRGQP